MKDKKRRIEPFIFYNHTGIERHFEKMAEKGWMIESLSNYFWTYRRIEPCSIKFTGTYYAKASDFDPYPSEEQQEFIDFCEHTGWKLAASWFQMKIFYNESESPIPIQTDPAEEVKTLHAACKKNFLPSYFILSFLSVLLAASFIVTLIVDPINTLANPSKLLTGTCWTVMFALCAVELFTYYSWLSRAKKSAADGIFLKTPNTTKFQTSLLIILAAALIHWIIYFCLSGSILAISIMITMMFCYIAIIFLVNGVKLFMKKMKASAGVNRTLTIVSCFILSFAFMFVSVFALTQSFGSKTQIFQQDRYALTLNNLFDNEYAIDIENQHISETVFIEQYTRWQRTHSDSVSPRLHYTVTTVKVPFLYDLCKKELLSSFEKLESIDESAWGADEAFLANSDSGTQTNEYLLCFPNKIVEIGINFEPSSEQMTIISSELSK